MSINIHGGYEVNDDEFFIREAIMQEINAEGEELRDDDAFDHLVAVDEGDDNRPWCINCHDNRTDAPDSVCKHCQKIFASRRGVIQPFIIIGDKDLIQ